MTSKYKIFDRKKFLLLFVFVMILNVSLSVFLLKTSLFGQTYENGSKMQAAFKAEVVVQNECPLQILIINIGPPDSSLPTIDYSLQNIGNRPIRGYTFLADHKGGGKVVTSSSAAEFFEPGKYRIDSISVENGTIPDGETVYLSIDYVEFADGSSWGTDSRGKSRVIAGERAGVKAAVQELKELVSTSTVEGSTRLKDILSQDVRDVIFEMPEIAEGDEWKMGYRTGYKTVISILQRTNAQNKQDTRILANKLNEIGKIVE